MKSLRARSIWRWMLVIFILVTSSLRIGPAMAEMDIVSPLISLQVGSGAEIEFKSHNGEAVNGIQTQSRSLSHLVLFRNGILTPAQERTLIVRIQNLPIPASGALLSLQVETQHPQGESNAEPILVWHESRMISNPQPVDSSGTEVVFTHEFTGTVSQDGRELTTPSDYFKLSLTLVSSTGSTVEPLFTYQQEYAFLMENQWVTSLPPVLGHTQGAAPDQLVVYYCDMFPYQKDPADTSTRIPREDITEYIGEDLVPALLDAFRLQSNIWGFTWYPEWRSYHAGQALNRLSVILTEGGTWFHGQAPSHGTARIAIRLDTPVFANYDSLTDAIVSTFHHELFHNHQRSINQHSGGNGDVDGLENVWAFFSEGTAELAMSVGQKEDEYSTKSGLRVFMRSANGFLAGGANIERGFNKSYTVLSPYQAVFYWRFLYEKCGGMQAGIEHPDAGMQVIRRVLETLYSQDVVDISASTDLVNSLPEIMDRVLLNTPACPFRNYADSLNQFSLALYALGLENSRCISPGLPSGCSFYDPQNLYLDVPVPQISYSGEQVEYDSSNQPYPAGIKSSYGMDFLEVQLTPEAQQRPLTIELIGEQGAQVEFDMQLLKLRGNRVYKNAESTGFETLDIESTVNTDGSQKLSYQIHTDDLQEFDRLGIILTRLDANERSYPNGSYTLRLVPAYAR
ncbi:MAG TPA: hypothetical protein VLA49_19295 [Anaerolineales bacterium]|nr:hypothetical protein [Anaerolineales bacterium]